MASIDEVQSQSQLLLSPAPYTPRSRPASPGLMAKRRRSLNGGWRRRRSRSLAVWIGVVGFFVTVNWWMFWRLQDFGRRSAPEISIKVATDANASSEDVLQGDWSNYEKGRRPHRLMYTRLLALAAHAMAEAESKPEPRDAWKETLISASSWVPCADQRSWEISEGNNGYILVSANGGISQQRIAICNAVAISRLLNSTLVLPNFLHSNVWKDESQFSDIYQEEHFISVLGADIRIVKELPVELRSLDLEAIGSLVSDTEVMKESKPSFYQKKILPILLKNRVVHFVGFGNRLAFDPIPHELQRLRCRCNFHALQFVEKIQKAGALLVQRMRRHRSHQRPLEQNLLGPFALESNMKREKDPTTSVPRYLAVHVRFEIDMAAYSLCYFGGGKEEEEELEAYRAVHFPALTYLRKTSKIPPASFLRSEGKCPLTPEEAVVMLAALGFKRKTSVYIAGSDIYGGKSRMAALRSLYPNLVTKENLLSSYEMGPFRNFSSQASTEVDFFTEYGEGSRYKIEEVIGKGSYGVVCSAIDTRAGEKVAIKKINDIFEHVSDATRILREIKLLRILRHPDIVEIKHILLPPSRREFKDIYVVFELMESDLHQVIKANDDLTLEHYQFFLYQLLRGLKYIHTANVFHRDLKPKNILANADCKLKICDFGLARVAFNDTPTAIFWTDYVATRWYRAPELCGSFFSKYTPAIDIWSIGCIFAELLTGKPLFPGKNVVHQLDLMTDLLGTPSAEAIARVRNEKARRYLSSMRRKKPVPFSQKFPNADPLALRLLERMIAFEPKDRPAAEEALADPYFRNIAKVEREPSAQPVTKIEFEFERRRITKEDVRELIYKEILEYHPKLLKDFLEGSESTGFMYPSAVDHFKKQFAYLEEHYGNGATGTPPERQHASLPRPCVVYSDNTAQNPTKVAEDLSKCYIREVEKPQQDSCVVPGTRVPLQVPQRFQGAAAVARPGKVVGSVLHYSNNGANAAAADQLYEQQRRSIRNTAGIPSQYTNGSAGCSYPRRHPSCKSDRGEGEGAGGAAIVPQPKPYVGAARKVAAVAHGGQSIPW